MMTSSDTFDISLIAKYSIRRRVTWSEGGRERGEREREREICLDEVEKGSNGKSNTSQIIEETGEIRQPCMHCSYSEFFHKLYLKKSQHWKVGSISNIA